MSHSRITLTLLSFLFVSLCFAQEVGTAEQDNNEKDNNTNAIQKQISDYWIKTSREHAETYTIAPTSKLDQPYKLYERAVFQHIQTVRGNDVGGVHLWIDELDRPAAVATVFGWTTGNTTRMLFNELHSMSDEPITTLQAKKPL